MGSQQILREHLKINSSKSTERVPGIAGSGGPVAKRMKERERGPKTTTCQLRI
jgi:hypothetical protein